MAYVITNQRSLTVGDRRVGLFFPKGKKRVTDDQYAAMQRSKILGAMLREGLLVAEQEPEPKSKARSAVAPAGAVDAAEGAPAKKKG